MTKSNGFVTFIYGPMYAGKTDELIHQFNKRSALFAPEEIKVFKPMLDTRSKDIFSRSGKTLPAINVETSKEILNLIDEKTRVILIDEYQFMDKDLSMVIKELKQKQIDVFVVGLDKYFDSSPIESFKEIYELSTYKIVMTSICEKCGRTAQYSQKLIDGNTAPTNSDKIQVDKQDGHVEYLPVCERCYK